MVVDLESLAAEIEAKREIKKTIARHTAVLYTQAWGDNALNGGEALVEEIYRGILDGDASVGVYLEKTAANRLALPPDLQIDGTHKRIVIGLVTSREEVRSWNAFLEGVVERTYQIGPPYDQTTYERMLVESIQEVGGMESFEKLLRDYHRAFFETVTGLLLTREDAQVYGLDPSTQYFREDARERDLPRWKAFNDALVQLYADIVARHLPDQPIESKTS